MIRQEPKIATGTVLLASPFMEDPNFKRSAVLITSHNRRGSMGFVFNKPFIHMAGAFTDSFPSLPSQIFRGGPVENNTLHFLHSAGDILDDSIPISPGIFWSGDFQKLRFLVKSGLITPNDIRYFMGYAGWDSGQLLEELQEQSWIAARMDPNYLFKVSPADVWQKMMASKGGHFPALAGIPENVSWN